MAEEIKTVNYSDDNIITLDGLTHIRRRAGMYIGKLGDGNSSDDGIYVLIKEVIDNSIDEFRMNEGNKIEITIKDRTVSIRDYGRGIPQGKMIDAVSKLNTGGKYDSNAFQRSIGLNGVGIKAVNALSSSFIVKSYRDGILKQADFVRGKLVKEYPQTPTEEKNGTYIQFTPDTEKQHPQETLFDPNFNFNDEIIETMLRNYSYLNTGLTIIYNGRKFSSKNGLLDLLSENATSTPLYPIVHLKGEHIEVAFTHIDQYGEEYYSFVNGQHTIQGGTHQSAFREFFAKTVKEFYNKNGMELSDIRSGLLAAIYISVQNPIFESQTKIKLGSKDMGPEGPTIYKYIGDFISKEVDNYLHKNTETANIMLRKIVESEKERKAIAGVSKLAKERTKKANLHNRKLRDCRVHYNDTKGTLQDKTCIFITEGDSASGSITQTRNAETQAVFSLRGKPFNSYGETKTIVYNNDEFCYLQAALNIEDGLEGLRYNKVIIATDADVDGMHIRLLLMTFFLQFFPDLIKKGHVYILQTPLFRVRNKKETRYCYTEEERLAALAELKDNPEITRFKGLGEISPEEFHQFIHPRKEGESEDVGIHLTPVSIQSLKNVPEVLEFYMGKNTQERRDFIVHHLATEIDA